MLLICCAIKVLAAIYARRSATESTFESYETASDDFCDAFGGKENFRVAVCYTGVRHFATIANISSYDVSPWFNISYFLVQIRLQVPRTITRPDVRRSFEHRFLAGLGSRQVSLFAVLAGDGHKKNSNSQSMGSHWGPETSEVEGVLSSLHATAGDWFHSSETLSRVGSGDESSPTHSCAKCDDGPEARQLKQWGRCLDLIEAQEHEQGMNFDYVAKVRPDDLW